MPRVLYLVLLGNVGEQERNYVFCQRIDGQKGQEDVLLKYSKEKFNSKLEVDDLPSFGTSFR
jgi:hypothetical protein